MIKLPSVKKNIDIAKTGAGPSVFKSSPVAIEARPPDIATGDDHATVWSGVAPRSVAQKLTKYRIKIPVQ
jgi:hypothetical protein